MANKHGYLPKAEHLTADDQARLNIWADKAYADDNLFRTLATNPSVLTLFLDWVGAMYSGQSGLDRHMVELCRIFMARRNECFH